MPQYKARMPPTPINKATGPSKRATNHQTAVSEFIRETKRITPGTQTMRIASPVARHPTPAGLSGDGRSTFRHGGAAVPVRGYLELSSESTAALPRRTPMPKAMSPTSFLVVSVESITSWATTACKALL